MAEKEVYELVSEVAGVEEESGMDVGSYQDLPKPDSNGDPENSYVFVAVADGPSDGSVDDKDRVVVDASVHLESVAPAEVLGVKTDIGNEDVNEPLKEGEFEAVEGRKESSPMVNHVMVEKEFSPVRGKGLEDSVEGVGSDAEKGNLFVVKDGANKPLKEEENGHVEGTVRNPSVMNGINSKQESFLDDADGKKDAMVETNLLGEPEIMQVEYPNGKMEELEEFGIENTNDENKKTEIAVEVKLPIEDPNGKLECLEVVGMEKTNDQNEKVEKAAKTAPMKVDDETISEPSHCIEAKKESDISNLVLSAESGEPEELKTLSPLNESLKTQDICNDEINFGSTDMPQLVVEDALESKLQEVKEEETEIESTRETLEPEVSSTASVISDLDFQQIKDQEETVMDANPAIGTEVMDNLKCDYIPQNIVNLDLEEEKNLETNTNCNSEIVCDEGKIEDFSVSEVEHHFLHPQVANVHNDIDGESCDVMNSETEISSPGISQITADSGAEVCEPLIEVKDCDTEPVSVVSSTCTDVRKSEIVEEGPIAESSAKLGSDCTVERVICTEEKPSFQSDYASPETEGSGLNSEDNHCSHAFTDVKSESEFHKKTENINGVHASKTTEVSDSFIPNEEGVANFILESADIEVVGDQLDGSMGSSTETSLSPRNDVSENSQNNHVLKTSLETGEDKNVAVTKPFNFLVRIPRFNDENLKEQIRKAKIEVDEKTRLRDAIQSQIQQKRANNQVHGVDREYAKGEDRNVRKLVKLKRMEIESLQSVINKAKNAISIDDMDSRISSIEHMIQHETLPLREEKQLIREIKQLNQLREQLSSNMGNQNEVQQALEQRHEAEECLKILKKELGNLKHRVSKAQTAAVEAESKYDGENQKVKELQDQFRAADVVRQEAYAKLQDLRKQLSEKYKYFIKYRDDEAAAKNYAFATNGEALNHLCMNQMENFMDVWNSNGEFRSEYVKFNTRSTVRRFGTLDGRSLGPDEKPHILPNHVVNERNERTAAIPKSVDSISQSPMLEPKQLENLKNDAGQKKVEEHKDQTVTITKKEVPKSSKSDRLASVSDLDVPEEVPKEVDIKIREEIELMRKEEEIRKEEAEAKRKEEVRLEQLAKANEAREKKKRHDEKVQLREELRVRKEAELKEKERAKKLRKKERKKAAASTANDNSENLENTIETVKEGVPVHDIPAPAPSKKHVKPSLVTKQTKAKSIPPPFRNRNKKKWQKWMSVIAACLAISLVFFLIIMGLPAFVNPKRQSPDF